MTLRKLKKTEEKVLNLLVCGHNRNKIAKMLDISKTKVYNIADYLVKCRYLARIDTGSGSPMYQATPDTPLTRVRDLRKGNQGTHDTTEQGADGIDILDPVINIDKYHDKSGKKTPDGYVEIHLKTGIECEIRHVGNYDTPRDANGMFVGEWSKPKVNKRFTTRRGFVRTTLGEVSFTHYVGSKGGQRFVLHPGRIGVRPDCFTSFQSILDATFNLICKDILKVLEYTGWKIVYNHIESHNVHFARTLDDLLFYLGSRQDNYKCRELYGDCNTIIHDNSPGEPESEIEGTDRLDVLKIYANLPMTLTEQAKEIDDQKKSIDGLKDIATSVVQAVASITEQMKSLFAQNAEIQNVVRESSESLLNLKTEVRELEKEVAAVGRAGRGLARKLRAIDGIISRTMAETGSILAKMAKSQNQMAEYLGNPDFKLKRPTGE